MAQRSIRWSDKAEQDKKRILKYWINKTKSTTFSKKLNLLFDKTIEQLLIYPQLGKKADHKNIRIKIARNYLIYYRITDQHIQIVRIWDPRNDPHKFKLSE
jgi:addiction module RelE/StbE family toxin